MSYLHFLQIFRPNAAKTAQNIFKKFKKKLRKIIIENLQIGICEKICVNLPCATVGGQLRGFILEQPTLPSL